MPVLASNNYTVSFETYLDNTQKGNPSPGIPNKRRGEKITFSKSGLSDYDFAFYAVNGVIRDDLPEDYQFTVRSNLKITAIFHKANRGVSSLEHVVVFADSNGHILDVTYVIPGASATEPANLPSKPNMVHSNPKWKTTSGITSLDDISSSRVYFLQYSVSEGSTFKVTTNAVTDQANYEYNEVATLTANLENEGVPFSHYEDAKGHVLSTNRIYKFTVFKDITVNAVYGNEKPSTPLVNMSDTLSLRGDNTTSYVGQFELSSGYELIEYGFVISRSSDVLTLESLGAKVIASNVHNGETREFLRTFENDAYNSIRAYLIVLNTTGEEAVEEVIYSENYSGGQEAAEGIIYQTGFESSEGFEAGSNYQGNPTTGNINYLWSFYFGTPSTNDSVSGSQSAQMRYYTTSGNENNFGYVKTDFELVGATKVTFSASTSSNLSLQVAYSSDLGVSWASPIDFQLQREAITYEYIINTQDAVQLKFTLVSNNSSSGSKLFIDDVKVYGQVTSSLHEIKYNVDGVVTEEMIADNGSITYEPTKEDHDFVGWYYLDAENNQVDFSGPIIQSRTLYAKFEIQSRTITFHYNGADGGQMPATQVVQIGAQTVLPIPTRTGYVFLGWFNESLTTEFDDPYTMLTINKNMYAKWEQTDEGKVLDDLNSISLPSVITETTTLDLLEIGTNGSTITWSSTNETVINPISGVVTLPTDENTEVTLTATGVFNGVERNRTFVITVNKVGSVIENPDPITLTLKTTTSVQPYPTSYGSTSWNLNNYVFTGSSLTRNGSKDEYTIQGNSSKNSKISSEYLGIIEVIAIRIPNTGSISASSAKFYIELSDNSSFSNSVKIGFGSGYSNTDNMNFTNHSDNTVTALNILSVKDTSIDTPSVVVDVSSYGLNYVRFIWESGATYVAQIDITITPSNP